MLGTASLGIAICFFRLHYWRREFLPSFSACIPESEEND
jgi:hypothetical protein